MHEHSTCEHEFRYCTKCDVVFCEKCGSEWYSSKNRWHVTYGNSSTYPTTNVDWNYHLSHTVEE